MLRHAVVTWLQEPRKEDMETQNPVIFAVRPPPTDVTAEDIGVQLSCDTADKQAAMFLAFARDVLGWPSDTSHPWPMQCRSIAEELNDKECEDVAGVLDTLLEHLRGIPVERRTE